MFKEGIGAPECNLQNMQADLTKNMNYDGQIEAF